MAQRFATIITNEKGQFSLHSSWKLACEEYGWEYKGRMPKSMEQDGMKIKKVPFDMTIDALELYEFIGRKDITQEYEKDDHHLYSFDVLGYDTQYRIIVEYGEEYVSEEVGTIDEYGQKEIIPGYTDTFLTDVISVQKMVDDEFKEVKINQYLEDQLLNFLKLEE